MIQIPLSPKPLANLMAAPTSADESTHEAGFDVYREMGGNSLHLHGEGGETHSRRAAGNWLKRHNLRSQFFLCTQICHDDWDDVNKAPISRYHAAAVHDQIQRDLELIQTDYLDLVYLDDSPERPFEKVLDALFDAQSQGLIRSFGVRNWKPPRIRAAQNYARAANQAGIAAVITSEFSLFRATAPLWPGYVRFDPEMRRLVSELDLTVLAWVADLATGQVVFADADSQATRRPQWIDRWNHPDNAMIAQRMRGAAQSRHASPREINVASLLNQPFPVIGMIYLPALLTDRGIEYERASQMILDNHERDVLGPTST